MASDETAIHLLPWENMDARRVTTVVRDNKLHLAPWEPLRSPEYFTLRAQARLLDQSEEDRAADRAYTFAIVTVCTDAIVGRIALTGVQRGPFQSCNLGYWVSETSCGRGYATQAVRLAQQVAFGDLQLHRVAAAVVPTNGASVRVLEKSGFRFEGFARRYLSLAGAWADHLLFAKTVEEKS